MLDNDSLNTGFRSLEFDLPSALLAALVDLFESMDMGELKLDRTNEIPNAQGVYQLFHEDKLVYVGKTDAEAGLRQRLSRHASTILSRHKLDVADMHFKAVQVLVFSAMDLEAALIQHYREQHQNPAWNGSGFGSNDPGRERDTTALREDGFDANYPINIDIGSGDLTNEEPISAWQLLTTLRSSLSYTLRFSREASAKKELTQAIIELPEDARTVRQILEYVASKLPQGWQFTKLPGRVIAYREEVDNYPGGEVIARS